MKVPVYSHKILHEKPLSSPILPMKSHDTNDSHKGVPPSYMLIYKPHFLHRYIPNRNHSYRSFLKQLSYHTSINLMKYPLFLGKSRFVYGVPMVSYDVLWFSHCFPMVFPRFPMVFIKGTRFIPRPTPPLVAPVSPAPQARSTPQLELRVANPRCTGHCLWLVGYTLW